MSINHRNYKIRAQKSAESQVRKSQNIKGFTACQKSGERKEFDEIAAAKTFLARGGKVIRNSDCVVVFRA
jgi:hypothetical protein